MQNKNNDQLELLAASNMAPLEPGLTELFATDAHRFSQYSNRCQHLMFDFSRTGMTNPRMADLVSLAEAADLVQWRQRLLAGAVVNESENRGADHTLLRNSQADLSNSPYSAYIFSQRDALFKLGDALYAGVMPGYSERITDVIHLGIGGSILGPQLVVEALENTSSSGINVHFLASADGWQLNHLMQELNPENTVVVAVSKSFSTREIQLNLGRLQQWLSAGRPDCPAQKQLIAITSQADTARARGFLKTNILLFPETICGRFSVWSAVGLPIIIRYGKQIFKQFLAGAERMDRHFEAAPLAENLPVQAALVNIWHRNVCDYHSVAIIPYDSRLRSLPVWLQQLDMESAGKSSSRNGQQLKHGTAPVIIGGRGTEAQHTFFQALYQGIDTVPVEFIGVLNSESKDADQHQHCRFQLANMIGQADALAFARAGNHEPQTKLDNHRKFDGNRPSTLMLMDTLNAGNLGELMAFYEHRVFVQSIIWGNNPFDQFGVEFGKQLADQVETILSAGVPANIDAEPESLHSWVLSRFGKQ